MKIPSYRAVYCGCDCEAGPNSGRNLNGTICPHCAGRGRRHVSQAITIDAPVVGEQLDMFERPASEPTSC